MVRKLRTNVANMPAIGFGTWQLKRDEVAPLMRKAIEVGFRHLDCAAIYENEPEIGNALSSLYEERIIQRSDVSM